MTSSDLDLLLRLRLVVARVGESDNAKWWASDEVLGPAGDYPYRRVAPRTGRFARAGVAFVIARERCAERVPSNAATLWALPPGIEEAFADRWSHWLDNVDDWSETFAKVEALSTSNVLAALIEFGLIADAHVDAARALRGGPPDLSVQLGTATAFDGDALRHLAAGFACSQPEALVVPYIRFDA